MEQTDKKISQMVPLQTVSGDEIVPVVKSGGNYSTLVSQIVALARQTMVEAQAGKGLSANDFTDALKAKLEGLSNYDDTEVRSLITAINGRLDTILGDGASTAIDTFNEIEAFLAGITDTQTLTGLLQQQKQTITTETDDKLAGKVDKVSGKGLSANDYTTADKKKLSELPTAAELTDDLEKKLDKEKWDAEHGQFTIKGYFLGKRGNLSAADSEITGVTPLLPLSKTYPIVLKNVLAHGNAVAVGFYDAVGAFISYPEGIEDLNGDFTVTSGKYPENACFFRVCTEKTGSSYSNGNTVEAHDDAATQAIRAAKLALFVDEFNAAAGANGKYDPVNAPDPQHPFYLNKLWLTYNEAVVSMAHINEIYLACGRSMRLNNIRTNILSAMALPTGWGSGFVSLDGTCVYNSAIEVLNVGNIVVDGNTTLKAFAYGCDNLHTIMGQIDMVYVSNINTEAFRLSPKLQDVRLYRLKTSISFKGCPLLSLATLQYLVDTATNTAEITVTVHPVTYGKLTDEQADIMALLPENLLTGEMNDLSGVTRIDNGVTVNAPESYFRMVAAPRLVNNSNGKLTLSCDVEGLQAGESIIYHIGSRDDGRPQWIISANGRATFSFEAKNLVMTNVGSLLFYDAGGTYTGQGLKLTNFKLSYGEHDALPYTPPLSSITDDATREKAEWLSLMQIAEARQINFVTTE